VTDLKLVARRDKLKKTTKVTRKELIERAVRYSFAGILASVAGLLTFRSLFADKSCREYDRCAGCRDKSNCSLVTKAEFGKKWKAK
jgi:hypothetical protein